MSSYLVKHYSGCFCESLNFPGGSDGKEAAFNAGHLDSIPGLGRSPGGEHSNPLQYCCLENPHEDPDGLQSMRSQSQT